MGKGPAVTAWMAEMLIIGWRDWHNSKRLPYPSELLTTFALFGVLSVLPDSTSPLPALLGAAVVIATLVDAFNPAAIGTGSSAFSSIPIKPLTTGKSVAPSTQSQGRLV